MVDYIDVGGDNLQSALDRFTDPFGNREALRRLGGTLGSTLEDSAREFAKNGRLKRSQEDTDTLLENMRYGNKIMREFSSCYEGVRFGKMGMEIAEQIFSKHVKEAIAMRRAEEIREEVERRERLAAMEKYRSIDFEKIAKNLRKTREELDNEKRDEEIRRRIELMSSIDAYISTMGLPSGKLE